MDKLLDLGSGVDYVLPERPYVLIGRHPETDIMIPDTTVSAFHAILVRDGADLYVLDHSFNGTHYPMDRAERDEVARGDALDLSSGSLSEISSHDTLRHDDLAKSRVEALAEVRGDKMSPIVGYKPGMFKTREDIQPLIDRILHDGDREQLVREGKVMTQETILGITEYYRFLLIRNFND